MTIYDQDQQEVAARIQEDSSLSQWLDWKWHIRNSVRDVETFEKLLGVSLPDEFRVKARETIQKFPMSVTPYYLSLIDPNDCLNDPVFKQCFPSARELEIGVSDMSDPLHEDMDSPAPGLTHRYPDRVLFHVSNTCSMYCRHCTRKRKVGDRDFIPKREQLQQGIDYIRRTPAVRDVLLSGGDPFLLPDDQIDWLLSQISAIPHVEVIRVGTRTPVVMPYRITDRLITILKRYPPLWLNTHFNHPREVTHSAREALAKLANAGIPLGNQTVLLAGVNDCPRIMRALVHKLVQNRVRPYYLYQCDLSEGLTHFRTPVGKGIEIIESLIGHTSGFAVPTYVIDAPGGGGKIPVMPNYVISWGAHKVVLRNYEGVITSYSEPRHYVEEYCDNDCANCARKLKCEGAPEHKAIGIEKLLTSPGSGESLTPEDTERLKRREHQVEDEHTLIGHSMVHHGQLSERAYLLHLDRRDIPGIARKLEELAQRNGYTKLLARVRAGDRPHFPGWEQEARIPGFYRLEEDGVFLAKYLKRWRHDAEDPGQIRRIVEIAQKKAKAPKQLKLPKGYRIEPMTDDCAPAMFDLYTEVFASYPYPLLRPGFLREWMAEGHASFYGVFDPEGELAAVAAAEVDEEGLNAEMTDFATRSRRRNLGLAGLLLERMEQDLAAKGVCMAYTIARSHSAGINVNFARAGYLFAGTLVNNTHIAGGLSSMNIWYKPLSCLTKE